MSICELDKVTKSYGEGVARVDAIREITLAIQPGEFTVFSGPSGSGKTTLLNQIGCLDQPTSGTLQIEGRATKDLSSGELSHLRAAKIGFIFQSFNLIPVLTALENVELALQLAGRTQGVRETAMAMFPQVGLEGLHGRRPNQLSGGQQQRVAIARALVKKPLIVIADEPTANLDSENGEQILELMRELNDTLGTTFLVSTHDPLVMKHARRKITMKDGQIAADEKLEPRARGARSEEE